MDKLKEIAIAGAAALVIIGGIIYTQIDNWTSEPTGPGSGDEANVAGSCNTIDDASTCVDYIGKYWATPQVVALNCQGVGVYTKNPCPQPSSGGCQMNANSDIEMISWFYPYGGDPVTGELIGYVAGACNGAGGNYINN